MTRLQPAFFLALLIGVFFAGPSFAAIKTQTTGMESSVIHLIWESDLIIKGVLILLLGMSVASWGIIFYKYKELKNWRSGAYSVAGRLRILLVVPPKWRRGWDSNPREF